MDRAPAVTACLAAMALSLAVGCTPAAPGPDTAPAPATEARIPLPRTVVSVDGDRIAVHDQCHADPDLAIAEDEATIRLALTVEELTGGDCFSCTVVTLDAPVGEREIIDDHTGEALSQAGDCFTALD